MGNDAALDFDTDMETIRNYVSAVVETKAKIATAYIAALDNVQTTFQIERHAAAVNQRLKNLGPCARRSRK
jgi:hypothetical protein